MIALTRNLGLVVGAALGLGVIKGSSIGEQSWLPFQLVMVIMIGLCALLMTLIIWNVRQPAVKGSTPLSRHNTVD
ncbi:hypothetical protein GCM10010918_53220 [Paenibacillus radicis (ex Gao et al. 2016)]|uniref:Uncharacterized protein n=2 Tax=Paenibacillus radicis (ex Gao et al. 2016) TaxID=1737354 RepID=A0A917HSP2_9BACL|nr:hypothetical protein GCM10010918_53220 [Paenibacillus radicis (ex Gao et al. 2016)]